MTSNLVKQTMLAALLASSLAACNTAERLASVGNKGRAASLKINAPAS